MYVLILFWASFGSGIHAKTKQFLREYCSKLSSFCFRNDISDFMLSISGSVSKIESAENECRYFFMESGFWQAFSRTALRSAIFWLKESVELGRSRLLGLRTLVEGGGFRWNLIRLSVSESLAVFTTTHGEVDKKALIGRSKWHCWPTTSKGKHLLAQAIYH